MRGDSIVRHGAGAALLAAAFLAAGCCTTGTAREAGVAFRVLEPRLSPYAEVTLEVDFKNRVIRAVPETAVIWFESKNPISEILWTVRCVEGEGMMADDLVCPPEYKIVIRPKKGCSPTLFGATASSPAGEIRIHGPNNAVVSGRPHVEEARKLLAAPSADVFCDGSTKESHGLMVLTQSVHDIYWGYEVEASSPRDKPFSVDPSVWIEKDG